ncbi:O-antigen ligase family protein [Chroogloeocystis siderophila]|uniref:O-antigen ligase-related domain-containing protein n=1 Tax=Chroogloeocystis siderophila 5.2 s.c.1 TaxID=247279 RepID=A0A1U7HGC5_9CHRO|nr:O-antigen ligase family protein [Chroogloeocystis siderophila]OKH22636.1 hypothetical protein NIES1031_19450 [Chroogloeocystis siderophila 5.2 s.c.1]
MRFAQTAKGETNIGITTGLAILLIGLSVFSGRTMAAIKRYPNALFFVAFLILSGTASLFASEPIQAIKMTILVGGYFLLAFSVAGLKLQRQEILQLISVFAISTALMSITSLIDYFHVVDIPRVNERSASRGLEVANLLGPFYSQTPMAAHLCLAFPIPIAFIFSQSVEKKQKFLWIVVLIPTILAAILTYSRGLFISFAIVITYIFYISGDITRVKYWLRNFVAASTILAIGIFLIQSYLPKQYTALIQRLSDTQLEAIQSSKSDTARFGAIESTLKDLSESPFGLGFTESEIQVGSRVYSKNAHSNIIDILRAGGPLGLLLFTFFILPVLVRAFNIIEPQIEIPLFAALVSFFMYGLTHTTIATMFAWILAGITFHLKSLRVNKKVSF